MAVDRANWRSAEVSNTPTQKPINALRAIIEGVILLGGMALFAWVMVYLFTGEPIRAWW